MTPNLATVPDAAVRRRLLDLAKALAQESDAIAEKLPTQAVLASREDLDTTADASRKNDF
jgi:hypothetical protein